MTPDNTDNTEGAPPPALLGPGQDEFPEGAAEFTDETSRRRFLALMGASVALATGAGCNLRPAAQRKILPYTTQPDEVTPGVPTYYASAAPLAGYGRGVLVRSNEGRPTKIEGNPDHPSSLGGVDLHSLASVLDLYDPDRSKGVTHDGRSATYIQALAALRSKLYEQNGSAKQGVQIRVLTETITSPTLAALLNQLLATFPGAKWVRFDAVSSENARTGIQKAFGKPLNVTYDFLKADVVVALDSDFLCFGPGSSRYSRDFADRRKIRANGKDAKATDKGDRLPEGVTHDNLNRLYAVETMPTNTGAVADHRLAFTNAQVLNFARTLAKALGVDVPPAGDWNGDQQKWVTELVKDLQAKKGKSVIVAGDHLPAWVHTLVAAMNEKLGNFGSTVLLSGPVEAQFPANRTSDLKALTDDLRAKTADVLLILGGANPAYSAPADSDFAKVLEEFGKDKSKFSLYLGSHVDETSVKCEWHVNEAHYLETWGDIRGHDGTVTIQQPLIAPLHDGRSAIELLAALGQTPATDKQASVPGSPRDPLDIVMRYWSNTDEVRKTFPNFQKPPVFKVFWETAVRKGAIDGTAAPADPTKTLAADATKGELSASAPVGKDAYELNFRPCPSLFDGRFANNGWLQELPKPLTKISWDNAAFVSPKTGEALGVKVKFRFTGGEHGRAEVNVIEIDAGNNRKIKAPVWVLPGHADGAITVHLGHGRDPNRNLRVANAEGRENRNADGKQTRGFNVYPLRTAAALWVTSAKAGRVGGGPQPGSGQLYILACTQGHWQTAEKDPLSGRMLDRKPVRRQTLEAYKADPLFAKIPPMATGETKEINENVPQPRWHQAPGGEPTHDKRVVPLNMYNPAEGMAPGMRDFQQRRWAMAIDLNACTGCSACVVACQSENNGPVVGKDQVTKGREMYWISIDRYYEGFEGGDPSAVVAYFQPRTCVQCENAPCEVVCPVGATTHSTDGLNDMAYNRCVGTRYCSNNCPYKVRRFNFLTLQDWETDTIKLGRNPDVSVRSRGVMEKCTFCVQRIRGAEIVAERELARGERKLPDLTKGEVLIKDGEILTACQAACPSAAIVFGDLNDPNAAVSRWKNEPRNYGLLAELNTRPRLTHMGVVRNPNPALMGAAQAETPAAGPKH